MKRILVVVLVVALAMIGATAAMAAVVGSKHDIRAIAGATGTAGFATGEVCVYCHTPHSANTDATVDLLWNKTYITATAGFTPYTSATSSVASAVSTKSPITRLCLSCHDGTFAVYAMGNPPNYGGYVTGNGAGSANIAPGGLIIGNPLLTSDFSNDHPIGFDYATAVSLNPAGSLAPTLPATLPLQAGLMECSTCHNVHDSGGNAHAFLRIPNTGSALCLTCHISK